MSERIIFDSGISSLGLGELEKRTGRIKNAAFHMAPDIVAKVFIDDGSPQEQSISLKDLKNVIDLKWALVCMTLKEMENHPVSTYYKDRRLVGISYPC